MVLPVAGGAAIVLPAIGECSNGPTGGRRNTNGSTDDRREQQQWPTGGRWNGNGSTGDRREQQ